MAKGFEKHKERQAVLSSFGKDLTRRSGAKCELCDASGVPLSIYEVSPVPSEPAFGHCLFACEDCREQLEQPKRLSPERWRFLTRCVWSEVPAVQVMAARLLDRFSLSESWAREALEDVYFDEEIEQWVRSERL